MEVGNVNISGLVLHADDYKSVCLRLHSGQNIWSSRWWLEVTEVVSGHLLQFAHESCVYVSEF